MQLKRHVTFLEAESTEQSLIKCDLEVDSVFISRQLATEADVRARRAEWCSVYSARLKMNG